MKPYTSSTFGRNHYYNGPKEHTVPKSSKDRRGTRTALRQQQNALRKKLVVDAEDSVLEANQ
ncbi:hypothetical protein [Shewanella colwelliana]|uniref:hypothetical protein n=1 Tax=Shewanella colwelliana TaxID=23 RepID=UPI0022AEE23F|nr:hypothetical protein [Shewanella colwelliana]MCZ4337653.1 hypothetical protein [Shewanella colwelliana]